MIKKIVFCLILLCCMSSVAFAENPSDNVNETTTNDNQDIITFVPYLIYNCTNLDPTPIDYYKDCNYTDTYMVDAETGKYIPLGEITKPLPENMVLHEVTTPQGWGLTYEDIMFGDRHEHSLVNYTNKYPNYTDTYGIEAETGKFIPLGEITKPLPENMVKHYNHPMHNGWGLTYEDIMNYNYQIHPLK